MTVAEGAIPGRITRRIAHILPALVSGGAQRVAVELARHAACSGDEVTILLAHRTDKEGPLRSRLPASVNIEYIGETVLGRFSRYVVLVTWILRRRKWLGSFDILHCHLTYGAVAATIVHRIRRASRPIIVETYHAIGMAISGLARRRDALLATQRDAFVLMATEEQFWKDFMAKHPKLSVPVILNGASELEVAGIDENRRRQYRRDLGIPDDCKFVVGTVTRLSPDRKPSLYMAIFGEVAKRLGRQVHFLFAGGGREKDLLILLASEMGISDQIHFTGDIAEPSFPLSIMDVYLTSNIGPVTGIAGMEAALAGCAVVALQLTPGYPGMEDWIWSSADAGAVGKRIVGLLADPQLRSETGTEQRKHARQHHSVDSMAKAYHELYENLLAKRPSGLMSNQ